MPELRRPGAAGRALPAAAAALLLLCAAPAPGQEAPDLYRFATPGSWVEVLSPEYSAAAEASERVPKGAWILLFDRQINVTAAGDESYLHTAVKLTDAAAVADYSQINVAVDPAFQTLDFHWLRVVRDGTVIDQRPLARITALPQETELDRRIYNGNYNINVLLADVRAGDVVEFAYTVRSSEQLFPGHFAARLDTEWGVPVHRERIRILSPLDRSLRYRSSDGTPVPEPRVRGGLAELTMEWTDVAPVAVDPNLPSWYYPWSYLEISDLESWAEAARLVRPLFMRGAAASTLVAPVADAIRSQGGGPREQALRALQYVQEQIRYTSISIGRGSHEPADPDTVLERRFGDCKDKALLLATILNMLGIDAQPALVHSWRGPSLADALPTPYAFDHAIVRAQIDGETYWLDATAPTRHRPLAVDDPADYVLALPVSAAGGLEAIPRPASDTRRREVSVVVDVSNGLHAPATLDVTTRYFGALADAMRPLLARTTPEQRQSDYSSYVARYYPGARATAPVEIDDNRDANVIEVRERYALEQTFARDETSGLLTFALHADELYPYADAWGSGVRQTPLGLEFPIRIRQRIVARLPEPWLVQPRTVSIENPAFRYRSSVSYADRTLELVYEYEALADHVPLAQLAKYQADRTRFYDDLGFVLTYDDRPASGRLAVAPLPLTLLLLALGLGVWGAVVLYRYDPAPRAAPPNAPAGIRGWLLLAALGMIVTPIATAAALVSWLPLIEAETWYGLPNVVQEGYGASVHAVALGVLVLSTLLVIASVAAAVLFFKKRTSAPVVFIALLWFGIVLNGSVLVWATYAGLDVGSDPAARIGEVARTILIAAAWTVYMLRSRRVRATFVRRRRRHAAPVETAPAVP
ncbi:MAG TPA: DUF3857 domain-containing protein [Gammaproteobacteria bacterium]